MQDRKEKILHFKKIVGKLVRQLRENKQTSGNKLANEYDLYSGNLSRLENGETDPQFSTIWKTAEALGIKFSEFAKMIEDELGDEFTLIDI